MLSRKNLLIDGPLDEQSEEINHEMVLKYDIQGFI